MNFTTDWAGALRESIPVLYPTPPAGPMTCLEIGSFEGMGSLILANSLCSHPDSRLYCVDPWDDVYSVKDGRHGQFDAECKGQYSRFTANTKDRPEIIPIRGYSGDIVPGLDFQFDFAYIDGEHSPEQVYKDATYVLPKMKRGGIILFDDFLYEQNGLKTGNGIRNFIFDHQDKVEVILQTYQLALKIL
jgi:predicted O-methyltransferase YrrM